MSADVPSFRMAQGTRILLLRTLHHAKKWLVFTAYYGIDIALRRARLLRPCGYYARYYDLKGLLGRTLIELAVMYDPLRQYHRGHKSLRPLHLKMDGLPATCVNTALLLHVPSATVFVVVLKDSDGHMHALLCDDRDPLLSVFGLMRTVLPCRKVNKVDLLPTLRQTLQGRCLPSC